MPFSVSPNSAFKPWKQPETLCIICQSELVEMILENPNLNIPQTHADFAEWVKKLKLVRNEHGKLTVI